MSRHTIPAVLAACLALWLPCTAAEFTSPEGFSLQYPDDWVVVSKQQGEEVLRAAKEVLPSSETANAPELAVMIRDPQIDQFVEHINVAVKPVAAVINAKAEKEYAAQAQKEMASMGANVTNFVCQRTTIADRDALSARFDMSMPGFPQEVRQWQVVASGGGKTYFLTCSALQSEFDQYEPIFSSVVNSLKIEGAAPGFWARLPRPLRYGIIGAIIGGVVGGLIGVIRKLLGKGE